MYAIAGGFNPSSYSVNAISGYGVFNPNPICPMSQTPISHAVCNVTDAPLFQLPKEQEKHAFGYFTPEGIAEKYIIKAIIEKNGLELEKVGSEFFKSEILRSEYESESRVASWSEKFFKEVSSREFLSSAADISTDLLTAKNCIDGTDGLGCMIHIGAKSTINWDLKKKSEDFLTNILLNVIPSLETAYMNNAIHQCYLRNWRSCSQFIGIAAMHRVMRELITPRKQEYQEYPLRMV